MAKKNLMATFSERTGLNPAEQLPPQIQQLLTFLHDMANEETTRLRESIEQHRAEAREVLEVTKTEVEVLRRQKEQLQVEGERMLTERERIQSETAILRGETEKARSAYQEALEAQESAIQQYREQQDRLIGLRGEAQVIDETLSKLRLQQSQAEEAARNALMAAEDARLRQITVADDLAVATAKASEKWSEQRHLEIEAVQQKGAADEATKAARQAESALADLQQKRDALVVEVAKLEVQAAAIRQFLPPVPVAVDVSGLPQHVTDPVKQVNSRLSPLDVKLLTLMSDKAGREKQELIALAIRSSAGPELYEQALRDLGVSLPTAAAASHQ